MPLTLLVTIIEPPLFQMRHGILDRQKRAFQVDAKCPVPFVRLQFFQRGHHSIDAGIREHNVEMSKVFHCLSDRPFNRRRVGDIHRESDRVCAGLRNFRLCLFQFLRLHIGEGELCPFPRKPQGGSPADAAGPAGHKRYFSVEHSFFSSRISITPFSFHSVSC